MRTRVMLRFMPPEGSALVCVVEVGEQDIEAARQTVREMGFAPEDTEAAALVGAAIRKAHALGVNPGGSCVGLELPPTFHVPASQMNRLLAAPELLGKPH